MTFCETNSVCKMRHGLVNFFLVMIRSKFTKGGSLVISR